MQITASTTSLASTTTIVEPTDLSVNIFLSADVVSHTLLINLVPPHRPTSSIKNSSSKRAPMDICCVIDVSGSMGSDAPIPGDPEKGVQAESTGLSVLDLVKHSLRTIITTMQEDDRIALVTFSDSAKVVVRLTEMTILGKKSALNAIERLTPRGSTNLWDGLKAGMNILNEDFTKNDSTEEAFSHRLSALFILTDGMPNISPPRGHIPMLKSYLDAHSTPQQFSISTFGFGYSLDTGLLLEIAQVGGGGYAFIPDPSMVGTVFIHAAANAYSTYAPRTKLDVEVPDGVEVIVKGGLPVTKTSWGVQIDAGDIQFGQSRNYVLVFNTMPAIVVATARYRPFILAQDLSSSSTFVLDNSIAPDQVGIQYHTARLKFVEILLEAKSVNLPASIEALNSLHRNIITSRNLVNYPNALAVAQDVSGQGLLGLEPVHFDRWGRHYFPSLALAHLRQQCGNFRDPGLQVYGRDSPIFVEERDKLDSAFDSLPPPKPSPPPRSRFRASASHHGAYGSGASYTTSSMSAYHSSIGPCFAGHCLVKMSDGAQLRVELLKRGMEVMTLKGPRRVAAVVRTANSSGDQSLCRIGDGLEITPWHPIRLQGQGQDLWVFPIDRVAPHTRACLAIYSVLLLDGEKDADAHSIFIGDVWCVTLGHGLTSSMSGDIRAHPFLGDYKKVLEEISHLRGFYDTDGIVESSGTRRSVVDGKICGFIGEHEEIENVRMACILRSAVSM